MFWLYKSVAWKVQKATQKQVVRLMTPIITNLAYYVKAGALNEL